MWTGERQTEREERDQRKDFIERKVLQYSIGINILSLSPFGKHSCPVPPIIPHIIVHTVTLYGHVGAYKQQHTCCYIMETILICVEPRLIVLQQ